MLSALDDAVGTVMDSVKKAGLDEKTLVVFLSDNGGPMDKYAVNGSRNDPLRGCKGDTWEGGIRVPFVFRWKGTLPAGEVYDKPIIQLDLLPTAVAIAGGKVDPEWKLDGVNLMPYLTGKDKTMPHETLYWRMGPNNWAIRHGNWKVVQTFRSGEPQLFDLSEDISEKTDLRSANPEIYKDLVTRWQAWDKTLAKPLWVDPAPNPYGKKKK